MTKKISSATSGLVIWLEIHGDAYLTQEGMLLLGRIMAQDDSMHVREGQKGKQSR